ncbi:MAG: hypothetical protein RL544_303 [Bacteroidota bacterium]|jgi:hypothetical protein
MKKSIIFLLSILISSATFAQVSLGFKAGYNAANVKSNDPDITADGQTLSAFHIGSVVNIPFNKSVSFQSGLNLGTKGVNVAHQGHGDKYKFTALDIPLNVVLTSKKGLFAGTGLNLGYNLSGKLDAHDDSTENCDFEFGKNKNFTRADVGVNFLLGYQTKSGLFVSANCLVSLTDIAPSATSWKNNVISLSIGYT